MKQYPDYKYRPRRKPKSLRKEGYPYSIPYPSVTMDAFRAGKQIQNKILKKLVKHCFLQVKFVKKIIDSFWKLMKINF